MEKVEVVCTKAHTYDYINREPGDVFFIKRRHSQVLIALKRVRLATESDSRGCNVVPLIPLTPKIDKEARSVDLDGGAPNDAKTDEEAARSALRAEYKELFGKDAHGRMSVERLRSEIEKRREAPND